MPPPSYLREFSVPLTEREPSLGLEFSGPRFRLACRCGSPEFEIMVRQNAQGEALWDPIPIPHPTGSLGESDFILEACCGSCGLRFLVFNSSAHGYDALLGYVRPPREGVRPLLASWKCRQCGRTIHRATFAIQEPDEMDIREIVGADKTLGLDANEWQDAFLWFEMAIVCVACGLETPRFVSYECG